MELMLSEPYASFDDDSTFAYAHLMVPTYSKAM